jgi:hypothetical protein
LSKKQQQLEQAHAMLLRHHEKTQDLEYYQQKSVHALREDQVSSKLFTYFFQTFLYIFYNLHELFIDKQTTRK